MALQAARAETTASTLRALEDQRNAEMTTVIEQHKEELAAAQSKLFTDYAETNILNHI